MAEVFIGVVGHPYLVVVCRHLHIAHMMPDAAQQRLIYGSSCCRWSGIGRGHGALCCVELDSSCLFKLLGRCAWRSCGCETGNGR